MKQTRNTRQRQLVRESLDGNYNHPTAEEVYLTVKEKHPSISRGTVYRNLNVLTENGEITRLMMPFGPDHYDFNTEDHYHFLCKECHRLLDANIPYKGEVNKISPEGCKTLWHKLLLIGLCPTCNRE